MRWIAPYLAVGAACAVSVPLVDSRGGSAALALAVGSIGVVAIVTGVRRSSPSGANAWWLLAVAVSSLAVAEATRDFAATADAPVWLRALPGRLCDRRVARGRSDDPRRPPACRRPGLGGLGGHGDRRCRARLGHGPVVLDPFLDLPQGPRRDAAIAALGAAVALAAAATRSALVAGGAIPPS